jgi:hypothetical protein
VDLLLSFLSLNRSLLGESEDKLKVLNDCNQLVKGLDREIVKLALISTLIY